MTEWIDTEGKLGVTSTTCGVGDVLRICHSTFKRGVVGTDGVGALIRGFRMAYPYLGELAASAVAGEWNCVEYHHKQPGVQILEFVEDRSYQRSTLEIIGGVMVHDHASIIMGGPAYATYYTEEQEIEGEGT